MMTTKLIGFATEYYTLWSLTTVPLFEHTKDGKTHQVGIRENYTYIQNLSKDLQTAKNAFLQRYGEKYGKVPEVDKSLKGQSNSFFVEKKKPLPPQYFSKGKYYGSLITECTDYQYLYWAHNNILSVESKEFSLPVLLNNGYVDFEGEIMSVEDYKELMDRREENEFRNSLIGGFHFNDGDKIQERFTLLDMWSFNGFYGTTYCMELITEDKRLCYYKGSRDFAEEMDLKRRDTVKIKGTVKHNRWYNDREGVEVKETRLQRIKIELCDETPNEKGMFKVVPSFQH